MKLTVASLARTCLRINRPSSIAIIRPMVQVNSPSCRGAPRSIHSDSRRTQNSPRQLQIQTFRSFSNSTYRPAQPPTADALMETLTDLYATAKDEFEIAAEETEKKTVYAEDDREAAKEALGVLKTAFEKAIRESDPETAKEVQGRTGPRIRELENALKAVEEMAMED